jgi:hypothetical protein
VLLAFAPNQIGLRVVNDRPLEFGVCGSKLERDEVLALEEVIQQ